MSSPTTPICDLTGEELAALRFAGKTMDGIYGWHQDSNPLRLIIGDAADYEKWRATQGSTPAIDSREFHLVTDAELMRLSLILSDLTLDNGRKRGGDLLSDGRRIIDAIRERAV